MNGTMPPDMLLVGMDGWLLWFFETETTRCVLVFSGETMLGLNISNLGSAVFFLAVFIAGL